eukprot:EG_transcript_421
MVWLVTLLFLLGGVPRTAAVNGTHIVIGMSLPTSIATTLRVIGGLRAALQEANDAGGVLSHNLTLVVLDDGNDPATAVNNILLLNNTYDAFLMAGTWGNDMFASILPTIVQTRIPLVGPFAGLPNTRTPFQDVVLNLRPSFADEIIAQARFLVEYLRPQRTACFYTGDSLGLGGYATLVQTLTAVGVRLMVAVRYAGNMTAALEAILSLPRKAQAVMLVAPDAEIGQFVQRYRLDPRADPNCSFIYSSLQSTSPVGLQNIDYTFFTRTVPPSYGDTDIARRFRRVATQQKLPSSYISGQFAFEGYVLGRFIVDVLKGMRQSLITREAFLNNVYNTRLFYLDDVAVGLFGRNFTGCELSICNCNSGMRQVYIMGSDSVAFELITKPSWPVTQYAITQCAASMTMVRRPILFGLLIPTDDALASSLARGNAAGIRLAFAELNAAGGLHGRQYDLITQEHSGDPVPAVAALLDRWPIVALIGSVVADGVILPASLPRIGTIDMTMWPTEAPFELTDVRIRSTPSLDMMAAASFLADQGATAHLRVRRSAMSAAQLAALTRSLNTFQTVPASSAEFDSAAAAIDGLSAGYIIGIGTPQDIADWVRLLRDRPSLTLLTFKDVVLRAFFAGIIDPTSPVMDQIVLPREVQGDTVSNSSTVPPQWQYGHMVGGLVAKVLSQSAITASSAYTTPDDMINAWYDVQTVKLGDIAFGPFYSANCSHPGGLQCECNRGSRTLTVASLSMKPSFWYRYQTTTCNVVYKPLQLTEPPAPSIVLPVALGVGLGASALLAGLALAVLCGRRNNRAAPKDPTKPFAVIFTDIQASTALWAAIPNDMAVALDTHHVLIRNLIHKYHCYEVKTIGDSFMCAHKSPVQALRFALAVQEVFHHHDWGTAAIDRAYEALGVEGSNATGCWNGLRVRVGIHFGYGDVRRDPVSHGYDYYGTVVNTAARIESVCHGGQVCVSNTVYRAVDGNVPDCVWTELGPHVLRGLSEPVFLYQVLPEGVLARRRFPPLRIQRFDAREEALQDGEGSGTADEERTTSTPKRPKNSVLPTVGDSAWANHDKWVEVHPLVVKGEATAEELWRHYAILQTGLSAMLASQLKVTKREILRHLCDRLHVANHGSEGPQLLQTLHALINRVLPATIAQQAARGSLCSRSSFISDSPIGLGRNSTASLPSPLLTFDPPHPL